MSNSLQLEYHRRPSTLAYMIRALYPSSGSNAGKHFPVIRAVWRDYQVDSGSLAAFLQMTGLCADHGLPILYAQVFGFPLLMVIVTHPVFPLPIWRALQIRNHLVQHRPISHDAVFDIETCVSSQRILQKGVEVDLYTTLHSQNELLWESMTTFYYRGNFGTPGTPSPLASAPDVGNEMVARWRTVSGGGWRFAHFTGDYNGIHWWDRYARMLGFQRAFYHPQLILGQCMARLPAPDPAGSQRLDVWLKGPVYYNSEIGLFAESRPEDTTFAVIPDGETRPAIVGHWLSCSSESRLVGKDYEQLEY